MPTVADLLVDLAAEQASLDAVLARLDSASWASPTPAAGWDVRDSIGHLCFFEEAATLAIVDPAAFATQAAEFVAAIGASGDGPGAARPDVAFGRDLADPAVVLARWRAARADFLVAAAAADPGVRVPWYGPAMSLASFTTARLMETWAHGTDVRDALGVPLEAGPRLRHVIHIGVSARAYAFAVHGVSDPGDPIRVEATAPDGATWSWGPANAADRVTGTALDLALVLTQRRHRTHTGVTADGEIAEAWLAVAQAFAGPPTVTDQDR